MNIISLDGVSKTLGESPLFEGVSLGIDEGDKIGFVGRNGRGKSTFLRILSGDLEPDSGTLARKRASTVSFLSQRTPVGDEIAADFLFSGESTAASLAAALREFHARGDDRSAEKAHKELEAAGGARLELDYSSICTELGLTDLGMPMALMSGGMAKKAAIARALAPHADLLLLDEPTNHLDIDTIEWLERRLASYPGAFVLVTHDRWFLDAVCTSVMEIDRRSIFKYPGGFSDHLRRRMEREAALEKAESRRLAVLKTELAWLARGARARATKSERRKDVIRDMQAQALEREASMAGFTA
ncbi:MAG: ATP-binding cassette domain-containing protein, partial [Spirochaetaceae bacterium]|nr:ATP-binding cassette domain-containing protein [Spirochaetaceae bacterium]